MKFPERRGKIFPIPPSTLLKYSQQWAVQFTHTLPAVGWTILIPLQIYPGAKRLQYHKQLGYVFVVLGLLMMAGFCVIDRRGLVFTHFDYPNIAAGDHVSAMGLDFISHDWLMRVAAAWFTFTLILAVYYARQKQFAAHRRFIYRHIASGLWVAVQRLWILVVFPQDEAMQKAVFGDGIYVGLFVTVSLSELAILATSRVENLENKNKMS